MTVEQFDPNNQSTSGSGIAKQTTTLETPNQVLAEQASHVDHEKRKVLVLVLLV